MSWKKVRFGNYTEFINGGSWNQSEYSLSGIPVVKVTNLVDGSVDTSNLSFLPESSLDRYKRHELKKNDLVITTVGSHPNQVSSAAGRAIIIPDKAEGFLLNQNAVCIRSASKDLDQKFLGYTGKSLLFQSYIKSIARGAANQVRIAIGLIKEFELHLPPLSVQQRIAGVLSAYDDLIENNLRRIQMLEEATRCRYRLMKEQDNGWEVKRADEVCDIKIGKTPPRDQPQWFNPVRDGIKWVSIKDINNSTVVILETTETVTKEANQKFNMNVVPRGTVILSFKLTVGRVAITTEDMVTNEAIAHFNIRDNSEVSGAYLYFFLKEFPFDSLGSTSSIGNAINSKVVKSIPVKIPKPDVLQSFTKQVDPYISLIEILVRQTLRLRQARDILLPRLMTGEIEATADSLPKSSIVESLETV